MGTILRDCTFSAPSFIDTFSQPLQFHILLLQPSLRVILYISTCYHSGFLQDEVNLSRQCFCIVVICHLLDHVAYRMNHHIPTDINTLCIVHELFSIMETLLDGDEDGNEEGLELTLGDKLKLGASVNSLLRNHHHLYIVHFLVLKYNVNFQNISLHLKKSLCIRHLRNT